MALTIRHLLSKFNSHLFYSTAAASTTHTKFLVSTLVNSLGFSKEEAISTSSKVTLLRPRKYNPNLVFHFLEHHVGFDKPQIKKIVTLVPALLLCDVNKHLKVKIEVLQEIGLSRSDLVKIITNCGHFFSRVIDCAIRDNVDYLRKLLGNDGDAVAKIIKRNPYLLTYNVHEVMPPNILFLRNFGLSSNDIRKIVLWNPRIFTQKPEWLEDIVDRVEKKFNIARNSRMFIYGINVLASLNESTVEKKLEVFRSFGWSNLDICTLVQKNPTCLRLSEGKIRNGLSFYMKDLGYDSHYLASRPALFTCSLEKRVMLRLDILKLLHPKKVTKCSQNLYTAVQLSELKFLQSYVLPFKDEMPEVYDLYIKRRS